MQYAWRNTVQYTILKVLTKFGKNNLYIVPHLHYFTISLQVTKGKDLKVCKKQATEKRKC